MVATDGKTGRGCYKQKTSTWYVICGENVMSAQMLKVSLIGVATELRLERHAWSMVK